MLEQETANEAGMQYKLHKYTIKRINTSPKEENFIFFKIEINNKRIKM